MTIRTASIAILLTVLFAVPAAKAGQIVENPDKPAAKDAGRVLKLEEVWRITDESGQFFFKHPTYIQIAADGSIFLSDNDQILKFSPGGKFLKNLLRLGQGPGEVRPQRGGAIVQILVRGSDLYILDRGVRRCWRTDLDGVFQEEFAVPKSFTIFVGVVNEGLLFWTMKFPSREERVEGKFVDLPVMLTLSTWEPGKHKDIFTMTNKTFASPRVIQTDPLTTALSPDQKSIYFVLGWEYLIQELDLASGTIVRRFRRSYQRVPAPARKPAEGPAAQRLEEDRRKGYFRPDQPFQEDISGLRAVGDLLLVTTSTKDETKGRLIDVFDKDGKYVDCFFTGNDQWIAAVHEDAIFRVERGADDLVSIVKLKIVK
jgi:hypothetical protein